MPIKSLKNFHSMSLNTLKSWKLLIYVFKVVHVFEVLEIFENVTPYMFPKLFKE